ncbi:hypothetical protein B296_00044448 [Ensete ventricosum]|uniref:Uncharacterized protein n=1 Tax=Ensete ventricosum TaxID=4639 RepID=A0A426Z7A6_ENSVE|nr:hypothetical protein B296_00044448 [Ensete ventricosum]
MDHAVSCDNFSLAMQCPIEKWYSQLSSYSADQSDVKSTIPWPKGSQFSGPLLQEKYRLISQVEFYFLRQFSLLLGICHLILVVLVLSEAFKLILSYSYTGLNPIMYLAIDQPGSGNVESPVLEVESASELITKETCLTFGIIYIGLKIIICSFSVIYSRLKAFWVSHAWHLNLSVLRESSQLLEQMHHVVEVNGLWSNLRFCNKTSNFQKGADNARAWASSFTSVSLGESSSSRLASSDSS